MTWPAASRAIIPSRARVTEQNQSAIAVVLRRLSGTQFSGDGEAPARHEIEDAHLFVLLAQQEITAGRQEQAWSLIDAAYAAFDRRFEATEAALTVMRATRS